MVVSTPVTICSAFLALASAVWTAVCAAAALPAASEALAAAVERGEYRDRLPSVRLLGELFQANSRTVLQALQELVARGIVTPNGNRGYLINRAGNRRPVTGNIVAFSQNGPTPERLLRPSPQVLEPLCMESGKRLIILNTSDDSLCGMRNFWQTLCADGVLFLNSTLFFASNAFFTADPAGETPHCDAEHPIPVELFPGNHLFDLQSDHERLRDFRS